MTQSKLRKDAARNRELLLEAGRDLFARRGLDITLNDIAHHAGVGVGTAYRRFPNKEALLDAIVERQVDELEGILHGALEEKDPWKGIVMYLEGSLVLQARDRAMAQLLSGRYMPPDSFDRERDRLAPLINSLADRARRAGVIRHDIVGTDLVMIQIAVISVAWTCSERKSVRGRGDIDQLYRRYLWIMLDGLKPERDDVSPLPVDALTTEQAHFILGSTGVVSEPNKGFPNHKVDKPLY